MTGLNSFLSFYGDDFTGSTDALESLSRHGVKTVLFTEPPTEKQLREYPDLQAFGVAGLTRSLPPDEMRRVLRPVFEALATSGAPIIHYKVCSTFDSSPQIGSIGCVIDLALEMFEPPIPVLAAAPALGRYCVFGNLFARSGGESEPYRLDRHPSMSAHPVTPMDEADLRLHLSKQTKEPIGLMDVLKIESNTFEPVPKPHPRVVLVDALYERHLKTFGGQIAHIRAGHPLFVIGSSGVEAALCLHWNLPAIDFPTVEFAAPILVICGSCSPVTAGQISWAKAHGFTEIVLDVQGLKEESTASAIEQTVASLGKSKSVVIHTAGRENKVPGAAAVVPKALGTIVRSVLEKVRVRRMLVAGGDTSSQLARSLEIVSVEMIGELTRGSPLCKARSTFPPADGLEITFKGGQIGNVDFFGLVERGSHS